MEREEILEGNNLIAEFMPDMKYIIPENKKIKPYWRKYGIGGMPVLERSSERLEFHSSWNELMPVIEKISKYEFIDNPDELHRDMAYPRTFGMINEETGCYMFRFNRFQCYEATDLIDAAFMAVIEFIKWYNNGK